MYFCPNTGSILTPIVSGPVLQFKSDKIGTIFPALPEHTLLVNEGVEELQNISRFKNTLDAGAFNPINPRVRFDEGCKKCKRKVVSFQRLGEEQRATYTCYCGYIWTN